MCGGERGGGNDGVGGCDYYRHHKRCLQFCSVTPMSCPRKGFADCYKNRHTSDTCTGRHMPHSPAKNNVAFDLEVDCLCEQFRFRQFDLNKRIKVN